jgi:CheY-like chemotaxis protein
MNPNNKQILCVDRNEDTRFMMSVLLGLEGYKVISAGTLTEGLQIAQQEFFDLYIIDQAFPDGMGTELCKQIRTFDQFTPILFYSAVSQESDLQQAINAGVQSYLIKPYVDDLEITVSELIKQAEMRAPN